MEIKFEHNRFGKRLKSMLAVDFRRMFTMRLFYIMAGICFVIPILILVMTTMMDGTVSIDPKTGTQTIVEGFDNTWQAIGTLRSDISVTTMDLTGMCNINMLYFFLAILVSIFVSDDFRSGYSKNLFAVRAKKSDYVISKLFVCFFAGIWMLLLFFAGAMLGGAIAGLPFDTGLAGMDGVVMCMLAKFFLVAVFVPIYLAVSVAAKQKTWLSMLGSFAAGMLLFPMVSMLTPLDSDIINVILCFVGGILFGAGLGAVSNLICNKTSLC